MPYRNQYTGIAKGNWTPAFKRLYNQENPETAVCECEGCGKRALQEFAYPDWDDTGKPLTAWMCERHARGLWCFGCGSWIGGTEDVFRYPDYECSHCYGWLREDFPEAYDDEEYDDYNDYTDEDDNGGWEFYEGDLIEALPPYGDTGPYDDDIPF